MNSSNTMFAPAERAEMQSILHDAEILQGSGFAQHVIQAVPSSFMILNKEHQIVYRSQPLMDLLGEAFDQEVLGKRPGELLGCVHAAESVAGCGTTEFCSECNTVQSILQSQKGKSAHKECRIISTAGKAYEFRVLASPFSIDERDYTLFALEDICNEKRRRALERTFFHDINNILSVIQGYSSLVACETDMPLALEDIGRIQMACNNLVEEISSHRKLLQAEEGDLGITVTRLDSLALLADIAKLFSADEKWNGYNIVVDANSDGVDIAADKTLLRRVLVNMVKNALEATESGAEICLFCVQKALSVTFSVHNPGFIPRSVQLQIFQRSFTTKGKGSGIGTYSMKLFGERYLKGKVWFTSSESTGTTFFISIPLSYEEA